MTMSKVVGHKGIGVKGRSPFIYAQEILIVILSLLLVYGAELRGLFLNLCL